MVTRLTPLRIGALALLAALIAVVVSASALASKSSVQTAVTVQTRKVGKLGVILVNSKGRTLYMFVRDKRKKVTCVSRACVTAWPPLKVKKGQTVRAAGAARKALLGKDKNPKGGFVVTYNHWPLYTYFADSKAGQANGQAINLNGGLWYVLSAKGQIIKKKP